MAINLKQYTDYQTVSPTRMPLDTSNRGDLINSGFASVASELDRREVKEDSLSATKALVDYSNERALAEDHVAKQLSSGVITLDESKIRYKNITDDLNKKYESIMPSRHKDTFKEKSYQLDSGTEAFLNKTYDARVAEDDSTTLKIETINYKAKTIEAAAKIEKDLKAQVITAEQAAAQLKTVNDTAAQEAYTKINPMNKDAFDRARGIYQAESEAILKNQEVKVKNDKLVTEMGIALENAKKLPAGPERDAMISSLLSDARVPADQKVELEYKTNNQAQYNDLSALVTSANTPEAYNSIINDLKDDKKTKWLTQEQKLRLSNQAASDLEVYTKNEAANAERQDKLDQTNLERLRKEYDDQILSGLPVNPEVEKAIASADPAYFSSRSQWADEFAKYKKLNPEARKGWRNDLQRRAEAGEFAGQAGTSFDISKVVSTLDKIDAEETRQAKDDPIGTYNKQYKEGDKRRLDPTQRTSALIALNSTGAPLIPYTAEEIAVNKTNWATTQGKKALLRDQTMMAAQAFPYDEKDPDKAASALRQMLESNGVSPSKTSTYAALGQLLIQPGNRYTKGVELALEGSRYSTPVHKSYVNDLAGYTKEERQIVYDIYRRLQHTEADPETGQLYKILDKEGQPTYHPKLLERAVSTMYGEKVTYFNKESWWSKDVKKEIRAPVGMTAAQFTKQVTTQMNNFALSNKLDPVEFKENYRLMETAQLFGKTSNSNMYLMVDNKNRATVYGYFKPSDASKITSTNYKSYIKQTPDKEYSEPIPFYIQVDPDKQ